MNDQQQFTITLGQLKQLGASVNALGQQIGAMATAPLLTQLNEMTSQPVVSSETVGPKPNGETRVEA